MECVLPEHVFIREVAPRDGFQSWPEFVPTPVKIDVVRALIAAGLKEIEVTSFVSPKAVPQMADAAQVMAAVPRGDVTYTVLVPNLKGAEAALNAGADQINVVISASEVHNKANLNCTIDQSLAALAGIVDLLKGEKPNLAGTVAVAFGCPLSGPVPIDDLIRLVQAYNDFGIRTVSLGDTTGMATPLRVIQTITALRKHFGNTEFILHLHNNRGAAMANLYAGLQAGVSIFDTALGGIGGCPNVPQAAGNLPTEDVVCMLEDMGIHTGVDLSALLDAARFLQKSLNRSLPGQVLKSGPIFKKS
jgi:hydroxymethylglutaryl-CoA lyase